MADQVLVCIGLTLWRYVLLPTMSVLPLKPRVSDLGASGGDAGTRARGHAEEVTSAVGLVTSLVDKTKIGTKYYTHEYLLDATISSALYKHSTYLRHRLFIFQL